jgi:molybdenum cofactor cytidylyltransferase
MGSPKQLLTLGGQSLVRRATLAVLDGGCDTVVVVTGAHGEAVAADLAGLTAIIAFNPDWPRGMGTSLRAGLAALLAAAPQTDLALVLLCDQPHLDPQVIRNLIAGWSTSGKPMAASEYADTVGPPCCFAKSQFASLAAIADHDGAKKLLLANPQSVTKIPWPAGTVDVDTPEDWRKITRE